MEQGLKQRLNTFNRTAEDRTQLSDEDHRNFRKVIDTAFVLDRPFSGQDLKEWLAAKEWPADAIDELVYLFEYCRLLLDHR